VLERTSYLSDAAYKDLFENKFEIEPFYFQHKLNTSALFQSAKLRELCGYCSSRPGEFHIEIGKVAPGQGWLSGTISNDPVKAFDNLETSNTLIMLKGVSHPDYQALLAGYLREVSNLLGFDFSARYRNPKCTIIIASPGRVTPYHMDAEQNLLMQVQGTKQFYVFDGGDPDVLSTESLERFWGASELNAARYTPELQDKAMLFEMGPGSGVHVPLTFPHWAQNGPEISVAVSINFQSLRCDQANVFRVNYMLRRLGFNPARPGVHKAADVAKSNLVQAVLAMKRISSSASQPDH
jgi:hypothetical protein